MQERLNGLISEFGSTRLSMRGRGMIWGIETVDSGLATRVCREAFQRGLMIETSGACDQVIKLLPPLTTSDSDLHLGFDILRDSLRATVAPEPRGNLPSLELCSGYQAHNASAHS